MKIRSITFKLFIAGTVLGVMGQTIAGAAATVWGNPGTGIWNEATNWVGNAIPVANADARINNGGTAVIDDSQPAVNTGFAVMADSTGTSGRIQMTGGRLNTGFDIRIGGNAATGGGTGVFDQSGGVIFMTGGNVNVGFGNTAVGTYNLSSGSIQVNSGTIFAVGNRGRGTVNQSGGTVFVRGFSTPGTNVMQLGRNTATVPASGTYNLSGGTLAAAQVQFGNAVGGAGSSNVFNLSGTGTLITRSISVINTGASNSFNFSGGNLIARAIGMTLNNEGGTFSPGVADFTSASATIDALPVNPIGVATIAGNSFLEYVQYIQGPGGTLAIDIADFGSNDVVNVGTQGAPISTGGATLAGTIAVRLLNGFNPPPGIAFDVLTADQITSSASVSGTTADGYGFVPSIESGIGGRQVLRLTVALVSPRLINPVVLADGSFQFSFRSAAGIPYVALTSTDVTAKLSDWTQVGSVNEIAPGEYQFSDSQAATDGQRFYAVQSQ